MTRYALALALLLLAAVTAQAQDYVYDDLAASPAVDSLQAVARRNAAVAGSWHYAGPAVELAGRNVVSSLGKPIVKGKVKRSLKKIYRKLHLSGKQAALRLDAQGNYALWVRGMGDVARGRYVYSPAQGLLTLYWHRLPVTCHVKAGKRLGLTIETDHMLRLLQLASSIVHNRHLADLAALARNYDHVNLGVELKR